jgi:hypothetical protein
LGFVHNLGFFGNLGLLYNLWFILYLDFFGNLVFCKFWDSFIILGLIGILVSMEI